VFLGRNKCWGIPGKKLDGRQKNCKVDGRDRNIARPFIGGAVQKWTTSSFNSNSAAKINF